EGQGMVEAKYVAKAVKLVNWALPSLLVASILLIGMLWTSSLTWRYTLFGAHFILVWAVSLFFLRADKAIWMGVIPNKDLKNQLKDVTRLTYCLADWPVFLSLTLLAVFIVLHWSEHYAFHLLEYGR